MRYPIPIVLETRGNCAWIMHKHVLLFHFGMCCGSNTNLDYSFLFFFFFSSFKVVNIHEGLYWYSTDVSFYPHCKKTSRRCKKRKWVEMWCSIGCSFSHFWTESIMNAAFCLRLVDAGTDQAAPMPAKKKTNISLIFIYSSSFWRSTAQCGNDEQHARIADDDEQNGGRIVRQFNGAGSRSQRWRRRRSLGILGGPLPFHDYSDNYWYI